MGHDDWVTSLCYSPRGDSLLTASLDKTLILWESSTGELLQRLEGAHHLDDVNSCAFHPAGKLVASAGSHRHDPSVVVWLLETGGPFRLLSGHSHSVTHIAFNSDNSFLSPSPPAAVTATNANATTANASSNVNFNRNNRDYYSQTLVTGSLDCTVRVWDFIRRTVLFTLPGHENSVTGVVYCADQVVSSSRDGSVRLWEIDLDFAHSPEAAQEPLPVLARDNNANNTFTYNTANGSSNIDIEHGNTSNSSRDKGSSGNWSRNESHASGGSAQRSSLYLPAISPVRRRVEDSDRCNAAGSGSSANANGVSILRRTSSNPWLSSKGSGSPSASANPGNMCSSSIPDTGTTRSRNPSRNPQSPPPGRVADPRDPSPLMHELSVTNGASLSRDIPHMDISIKPPDGSPVESFDPVFGRDARRTVQMGTKSQSESQSQGDGYKSGASVDTRATAETTKEFQLLQKVLGVRHPITGAGTGTGTSTTNLQCRGKCLSKFYCHNEKWVVAMAAGGISLKSAPSGSSSSNSMIIATAGEDGKVQAFTL